MPGSNQAIKQDWLPPAGAKLREFEKKALELRRFAGLGPFERLDPFRLAEILRLKVVTPGLIRELSDAARETLAKSSGWSGAALKELPDGTRLIFINDRQSPERQAATLMEEICHTLLGHDTSLIFNGNDAGRTYNRSIEEEAYGVGAAALVPYKSLSESIEKGHNVDKIAKHFGVTRSLVEFRIRQLKLW